MKAMKRPASKGATGARKKPATAATKKPATAAKTTKAAPTGTKSLKFPKGFLWGSATAAYQIEGVPLKVEGQLAFGIPFVPRKARSKMETMALWLVTTTTASRRM